MFVPAKSKYLSAAEVAAIKPGDTVDTDSGLGGSYEYKITKVENGVAFCKCSMKDHEHKIELPLADAVGVFYSLVPA